MNEQSGNLKTRPKALTVLAILSFVGSGLSAISNLFVFFNHSMMVEMVESGMFSSLEFDFSILTSTNKQYFLMIALLNIVSFSGVRQMWLMRRSGFHVYAISQLLMLIVSTVFVFKPSGIFPMFDLLLTGIFILYYLRFREQME